MEFLDKGMVACLDEFVVAYFNKSVVGWLDKNNKDNFDMDIRPILDECSEYYLLSHPLKYILEGTLGGKIIVHNGYTKDDVWYETYVQFYHDHKQKN